MSDPTQFTRELDAEIARACGYEVKVGSLHYETFFWAEETGWNALPHYSRSLDAITALIEEKLLGWTWLLDSDNNAVAMFDVKKKCRVTERGETRPLALCRALLTALEGREDD